MNRRRFLGYFGAFAAAGTAAVVAPKTDLFTRARAFFMPAPKQEKFWLHWLDPLSKEHKMCSQPVPPKPTLKIAVHRARSISPYYSGDGQNFLPSAGLSTIECVELPLIRRSGNHAYYGHANSDLHGLLAADHVNDGTTRCYMGVSRGV